MSDLVERLRAPLGVMQCEFSSGPAPENRLERRWLVALEAADEIERLSAALREIADHTTNPEGSGPAYGMVGKLVRTARAALGDK